VLRWIEQSHHRHRLLGLALLALQAALMLGPQDALQQTLVLVHFALILLWQPFLEGSRELVSYRTGVAIIALAVAIVLWSSWLLLAVWLLVLIAILGGELALTRRDQFVQGAVLLYLLMALLAGVTPPLFRFEGNDALTGLIDAAGLIPLTLVLVPAGPLPQPGQRFDYLRTAALGALVLLLWTGAALWTYRSSYVYPVALVHTLLFVAAVLLLGNWLWRRRANHTMFEVLWNRYLLNLGTPFEHYLVTLSGPEARGLDPDAYLDRALDSLSQLEWVAGVEARGPVGHRLKGQRARFATEAHDDTAPLIVHTDREPGPALRLHIQLLARLVQQLYLSRVHEAELRDQEKARAVYETGARLTHDIKNLLQSLQSLAAAVEATDQDRSRDALGLVQRQLPEINQRLQATLDKLRDPAEVELDAGVSARAWWQELQARYGDGSVAFEGTVDTAGELPRELFDTTAENLIANARHKQAADPDVAITASLQPVAGGFRLCVCDTGAPMSTDKARNRFDRAVGSTTGLGVGLYQCTRLAERMGYELSVAANEPGRVCLALHPRARQNA